VERARQRLGDAGGCKGLLLRYKDEIIRFSEENMKFLKVKPQIVLKRILARPLCAISKIRKFGANSNC